MQRNKEFVFICTRDDIKINDEDSKMMTLCTILAGRRTMNIVFGEHIFISLSADAFSYNF